MRKLLGNLVLVVLIVLGIGFFRGWFTVSREDQPGQTNVEVKIDKAKVKDDADEVARKARELREEVGQVIHNDDTKPEASNTSSEASETSQP